LLNLIDPGAELVKGDVEPGFLVMLKRRLGGGDKVLPPSSFLT
jgi:hypothetical protein